MNPKNPSGPTPPESSKPRLTGFEPKRDGQSPARQVAGVASQPGVRAGATNDLEPLAPASGGGRGGRGGSARSPATPADDVFLSPRVVDRQAFSEFSQSLRDIINQAASTAAALQKAATEAERSRDGLREALAALQAKADHVTGLLATAQERAQQSRPSIDDAGVTDSLVDDVRARTDATIEQCMGRLAPRLEETLAGAEARLGLIERRVESLLSDADRRVGSHAAGAVSDGAALGALHELVSRADVAKKDAAFATRQLDSIRDQADQARQALGLSVSAALPLIDEVAAVRDHLSEAIDRAQTLSSATQQAIEDQFRAHQAATDNTIARLTADVEIAKSELAGSVQAASQAHRDASSAAAAGHDAGAHLAVLLEKLEPWHAVLLSRGGAADADLPMPLREILDRVRVDLKRDLSFVASALRSVAQRAESSLDGPPAPVASVIAEAKPVPIPGTPRPAPPRPEH
ncbi:MAG: hypothetical protein AB7O77_08990 [Phycisphaerales bacterium]